MRSSQSMISGEGLQEECSVSSASSGESSVYQLSAQDEMVSASSSSHSNDNNLSSDNFINYNGPATSGSSDIRRSSSSEDNNKSSSIRNSSSSSDLPGLSSELKNALTSDVTYTSSPVSYNDSMRDAGSFGRSRGTRHGSGRVVTASMTSAKELERLREQVYGLTVARQDAEATLEQCKFKLGSLADLNTSLERQNAELVRQLRFLRGDFMRQKHQGTAAQRRLQKRVAGLERHLRAQRSSAQWSVYGRGTTCDTGRAEASAEGPDLAIMNSRNARNPSTMATEYFRLEKLAERLELALQIPHDAKVPTYIGDRLDIAIDGILELVGRR